MTNAYTSNGLFGDLFHDPEMADAFSATAFLKHAMAFEIAWTETLASLGAIDPSTASAAIGAMQSFTPDMAALGASSNVNGLPIPGLIAQLRDGLPGDAAKAIHTGATSQDVIDTATVLTLLGCLQTLEARLTALVDALAALAHTTDAKMMARTRMQAALPIPVSARVQNWSTPLRDYLDRIDHLRASIGRVQLGGPVGLRDVPEGQGEAAAMDLARRLGLRVGPVWHTNRSPILDVGHWLTLVSGSLGKMGQDIALMAQQGLEEIKLNGGGGSSAMPHKQNPILAEALITLARFVAVQQGGLAQAMVHEQERSGAAWALEWMILPPMVEATGAALRHAETLITQIDRIGPA